MALCELVVSLSESGIKTGSGRLKNQLASRSGDQRKKEERPHHDRSSHPDQGAQEQHMADAPRFYGEPRHALPLVFQEPFQAQVGRL